MDAYNRCYSALSLSYFIFRRTAGTSSTEGRNERIDGFESLVLLGRSWLALALNVFGTKQATYGDFDYLNEPPALNWVVLECASCNDGKGLRIVRQVDAFFKWHGEETTIELEIRSGNSWVRDPLNGALPFTSATECEVSTSFATV